MAIHRAVGVHVQFRGAAASENLKLAGLLEFFYLGYTKKEREVG